MDGQARVVRLRALGWMCCTGVRCGVLVRLRVSGVGWRRFWVVVVEGRRRVRLTSSVDLCRIEEVVIVVVQIVY